MRVYVRMRARVCVRARGSYRPFPKTPYLRHPPFVILKIIFKAPHSYYFEYTGGVIFKAPLFYKFILLFKAPLLMQFKSPYGREKYFVDK